MELHHCCTDNLGGWEARLITSWTQTESDFGQLEQQGDRGSSTIFICRDDCLLFFCCFVFVTIWEVFCIEVVKLLLIYFIISVFILAGVQLMNRAIL